MSATTGRRAFVTLLTSDSYLAGALTCINSLLDVEGVASRGFETVCLVTPATVGQASIKALQKTFDAVVGVAEITTESWKELDLLGRKDLAASLTKLHLFRLTQYSKLIFLDADTLVLRPLSPLFDLPHSFSAAPDSGWPDAFNSGVMVTTPSEQTFKELIAMMAERGTWDGGDQGLLNDYFSDWHRLSFTYNVTPSAYYTYAPAYRRHGSDVAVLHFIGKDKPWKRGQRAVYVPDVAVTDYYGLVNQWFDVFERHFGTGLTYDVASRVINPPASFKSTYTDLAPHTPADKPIAALGPPPVAPIAIASSSKGTDSPPHLTWDPATSSPPRDPNAFQMRVPITGHYENMWDDPSKRKQKARFEPPSTYAAPPPSTHDWYKEVMAKQPDPTAVRPVFPWEKSFETESAEALKAKASKEAQATATQPPPKRDFPSSTTNSPPNEPTSFAKSATFTNAWDAIPGINRYAKNLARSTKKTGLAPVDTQKAEKVRKDDLGGRQSSLKELVTGTSGSGAKRYEKRSDASSRDGDDEDDDADTTETEDEDERDRYKIAFKSSRSSSRSATGVETGELSPTNTRSRSGDPSSEREFDFPGGGGHPRRQGSNSSSGSGSSGESTPNPSSTSGGVPVSPTKTRKDSRFVPTSPRQSQGRHTFHSSSSITPSTTSSDSKGPLRLNTSAPLPTTGTISPRLAAQAIRNSAAARLSSTGTGTGNGPPVVRATRVFSPETDTTVVKQQGLAALQRFVENFEAATGSAAGGSATGGAGTAGSWRY